jgi:hypothetical protein
MSQFAHVKAAEDLQLRGKAIYGRKLDVPSGNNLVDDRIATGFGRVGGLRSPQHALPLTSAP